MKQQFTRKNILIAFGLIAFAITGRLLLHDTFPNVETLTVATLLAGALLGPYFGVLVGLLSVVGSDAIIHNTPIFVFTWSAWMLIGLGSAVLKKRSHKTSVWGDTLKLTGAGIVSTLFFYLFTNFGVWAIGITYAHLMYPMTWQGLVQCYVMGLPFLRNQFLGNLFIVPVVSLIVLTAYKYVRVPAKLTQLAAVRAQK